MDNSDLDSGSIPQADQQHQGQPPVVSLLPVGSALTAATVTSGLASSSNTPAKKPRGRPRKYPEDTPTDTKLRLRSKTGCLPCRQRKKKCDEVLPKCRLCLFNGFDCQRPTDPASLTDRESRARAPLNQIPHSLTTGVEGIDSPVDCQLFDHIRAAIDQTLGHFGARPLICEDLVRMACSGEPESRGLMHSLLWLSGVHLSICGSPGPELTVRMSQHYSNALTTLQATIAAQGGSGTLDDAAVAQTVILCQESLIKGLQSQEYITHLHALYSIIASQEKGWLTTPFRSFVVDFYLYFDCSCATTSLLSRRRAWPVYNQDTEGTLAGICKSHFLCHARITVLRENIRQRRQQRLEPSLDGHMAREADLIMNILHSWEPPTEYGHFFYVCTIISQHITLIYLYCTVSSSMHSTSLKEVTNALIATIQQAMSIHHPIASTALTVFQIGVAAFEAPQRAAVEEMIDYIQSQRVSESVKYARLVLHQLWKLIDEQDERSWDWETVMSEMGLDLLLS